MTEAELKDILAKHKAWRNGTSGGKRADLRGADLRGAYLRGAYLRGADLRGADLRGADLRGAYLRGAYLVGADLRGAYLGGADLRGAYLRGAYLRGAKLDWADHTLLSEILFRAAKESLPRRQLAGLVAISTDWCWPDFLSKRIDAELRVWALKVLLKYRQPDDDIPSELQDAWDKLDKKKGN